MPEASPKSRSELQRENRELRSRLEEAEEALDAIRSGAVDGIVVNTERGNRVFTLVGEDHPYRLLVEEMAEGALTLTPEGVILYANGRLARLLRVPLETIIGSSLYSWVAPIDGEALRRFLQKGDDGRSFIELRLVAGDDVQVAVSLSVSALNAEDGFGSYCVVVTDLTEHKRAEAAVAAEELARVRLEEAERSRRALVRLVEDEKRAQDALRLTQISVDGAADMIAWMDRYGRLLYANSAFCRRHGFSREELVDKTVFDVDPGLSAERWLEQLPGPEEGGSRVFEGLGYDRGGSAFPVEVTLTRCEHDGEEYFFRYERDISERKQAEAALRQQEEQLRQSQKMEAVGQLAGGIAHDFNNLMCAVIGYSELLLASPELSGSPAREDVEEIRRAADRAAALTAQILAFSRKQVLQPTAVSLNQVLSDMEPLLRRTLGEHLDLSVLAYPDLGTCELDVHKFEQVLMNLALNARDAMGPGGRLTLETANVELDATYCEGHADVTPGPYVMLAVSDTGAGIPADILPHVFEPFFTTKPTGQGTGLGLSTVYGIVRQSGGHVFLYSEPGSGATFKVYLPRIAAPAPAAAVSMEFVGETQGTEAVLVVEDETGVRDLVCRALGSQGYEVLGAASGAEALGLAAQRDARIDLLLTDLVLPGAIQGVEVADRLRASRPDILVLYMSGYTRNAIEHAGRLDPDVDFLPKPFTLEELCANVRAVLDNHRR